MDSLVFIKDLNRVFDLFYWYILGFDSELPSHINSTMDNPLL